MKAITSGASSRPRRARRRTAACSKSDSLSTIRPSRSKTTARAAGNGDIASGLGGVFGIEVGQRVGVDRLGGVVGGLGLAQQVGHLAGVELLRVLRGGGRRRRRQVRAEVDAELVIGDTQLVVGQQGGP